MIPPLIIFQHLPKTGGTTLAEILIRHFPVENRIDLSPPAVVTALGTYPLDAVRRVVDARAETLPPTRLIGGHLGFGVHRFFSGPAKYMSLLRDPVERLISAFYYSVPDGRTPSGEAVTFEDYIFRRRHYDLGVNNHQVRAVCGTPDLDPVGPFTTQNTRPLNEVDYESARRNLEQHYQFLGVTDRFDEFLVASCRQLGWRLSEAVYFPRNVTPGRPCRDDIPTHVVAELERQNTFDRRLYEFASATLSKVVQSLGSSFGEDVDHFRNLNRAYQAGVPVSELDRM